MKDREPGINSKHYGLALLEAVFGAFGKKSNDEPGSHARCARCGVRFTTFPDGAFRSGYCSDTCREVARNPTPIEQGKMSRQQYRHRLREKSKQSIAAEMGAGPAAMNPRRNRRRAMLSKARRWFTAERKADAAKRAAEAGGETITITDKRRTQ